jgi:hypothetical protein
MRKGIRTACVALLLSATLHRKACVAIEARLTEETYETSEISFFQPSAGL